MIGNRFFNLPKSGELGHMKEKWDSSIGVKQGRSQYFLKGGLNFCCICPDSKRLTVPKGWPFRFGGMPTRQEILKYHVFNGAVWGHLERNFLASFHRKMTLFYIIVCLLM